MHTIKFSIKLNTFQIGDKDLTTNNICKKSEQYFKIDDTSVHHIVYVSFLDDSLVRRPPSKVLMLLMLTLVWMIAFPLWDFG